MKVSRELKLKGKTAVFIDAANIELSAKDLGFKVDYKKLLRWLSQEAKLAFIGFYTVRFNTKEHDGFLTVLKKSGYKLVTKPIKLIKNRKNGGHVRKANFDVEIAVDLLQDSNNYQTAIIFSGDSDFEYVIRQLIKKNKKVVICSSRSALSRELIRVANEVILLGNIRKEIEFR